VAPSGSHLDLIGGFTPAMREADDACFAGAALYVDTEEALQKSGDLLGPMQRGVFTAADVRGTLATLARGEASGRRSEAERTVFKSVGTRLEDLAAAHPGVTSAARLRSAASAHRHQAGIAAGGGGVDAERALDHQPLERDRHVADRGAR
jgi:ornithine cyclodeaminase/alanine dehydrogenase-like protein (mu-crystallin family)